MTDQARLREAIEWAKTRGRDPFGHGDVLLEAAREHVSCGDRPMGFLAEIAAEMERQDKVHPSSYPSTRDGVRLGLAVAQDELNEALDAWRESRCKCDTPMCDHADWSEVRKEVTQVAAILARMVREFPDG